MKKVSVVILGILISVFSVTASDAVTVKAPSGSLVCTIQADKAGHLAYSVEFRKQAVILSSPLGVIISGDDLGKNASLDKVERRKVKETYKTRGIHSTAVNNYNEALIPVTGGMSGTPWLLEVRVFPDAVAYRYRVAGQGERTITGESSAWQLMRGTNMWYQSNNKKDYEAPFFSMLPDTITTPLQLMTTATFKLPDNLGYAKISEANLIDYSDMTLETSGGALFRSLFHNSKDGWKNEGEILSPWRVAIVTPNLNELANTDVFHNLCPPPAPELVDAPWIKPGKSTWHWMVVGRPVFKDQRQWVDWTSQLGFDYYLVDDGWKNWSDDGKDGWNCLEEVVKYATSKNVKVWAWVRTTEVRTEEQRNEYFDRAKRIGLVGLKIDFMGPANPEWVNWYDDVLRQAAKAQLMVNFHGSGKPTGRERTYPHEMTREGIRGREMGKQPARHDVSLPFTRFVQGHADYTPVDFRTDKLKGSTWAHELAMAVIFTSPFQCFSGTPESYLESQSLDLLRALPTVWDETIVLPGSEIGEVAAFARRYGDDWYIGIINGTETAMDIKLDFLGKGDYTIEEFRDVAGKTDDWTKKIYQTNNKSSLQVNLNKDGGYVARIYKLKN